MSGEIIDKVIAARRSGNPASAVIDELSSESVRKAFAELAFAAPQRSKIWWEEIRPGSETPDYLKWISQLLISFELEQIEQRLRMLTSRIADQEKKGANTDNLDYEYQELVQRKRVLSETYRDKELLEHYFESLR